MANVVDSFDRAVNTGSLGTADSGQTWSNFGGGWLGINASGQAQTNGSNTNAGSIVDAGSANVEVEATIVEDWDTFPYGFCVRYVDDLNFLDAQTFGSKLYIRKIVAGANTDICNSAVLTWAAGDIVKIVVNGSSLEGYHNGVLVCSGTDSTHSTGTSHGLLARGGAKYDDFSVTDLDLGGNTAPTATITAPATASSFDEGETIGFTGTGTDTEDGALSGASLAWSSDLDGALGTGTSLNVSTLSVGTHTITLTVTDSGSLTDTDTITVTVNAVGGGDVDFSFVQQKNTELATGVGSGNLILDSVPTEGNLLLLMAASPGVNQGVTSLVQTGVTWTKRQDGATNTTVEIWEGEVGSGASATIAITREASANSCAFSCIEVVPASGAAYNAGLSGTSAGNSTTPATVSVSPASASKWVMVSAVRKSGTSLISGPASGWTALTSSTSSAFFAYKLSNAGPGTSEQNAYQRDTSTGWDAALVTIYVGSAPNTAPTASITGPASGTTYTLGDTVPLTGTGTDTEDGALSGASLAWSSSIDGALGTGTSLNISSLSVGTHTITLTATDSGLLSDTDTITVTVELEGGGSGSFDGDAELPRVTPTRVDIDSMTFASTTTCTAANLQSTIDAKAALGGSDNHEIIVQDGQVITTVITLPTHPGTGYIVIRSETMPCVRGIQAHPSMITTQAEFRLDSTDPCFRTDPGVAGCDRYVLAGIYCTQPSTVPETPDQIHFGAHGSGIQTTLAQVPEYLHLDRCVLVSDSEMRRNVALHCGYATITECYLQSSYFDEDNQAIFGVNGPGPHLIEHNYLEGSGENIMYGGSSNDITDMVPSDITIRMNMLGKPLGMAATGAVKNSFELKCGIRVLIEGNCFVNCPKDSQSGIAILIKSVDQDGVSPWLGSTDVTFRHNFLLNIGGFVNVSANPQSPFSDVDCDRVTIRNNVAAGVNLPPLWNAEGRSFQFSGGVGYQYKHNTVLVRDDAPQHAMAWLYGPLQDCIVTDNIDARPSTYGIRTDSTSPGTPTWNAVTTGTSVLTRNVIGGSSGETYPAGNWQEPDTDNIGFTDATVRTRLETDTPDEILAALILAPSSPYKGQGDGGSDVGAEISTIRGFMDYAWVPGLISDETANYTGPGPNVLSATPVATALAMVTQPNDSSSGAVHSQQPAVEIRDQFADRMTTDDTTVVTAALVTVTGTGTALGTLTATAVDGLASFTDLGVTSAAGGTFKWRFTSGSLTLVESSVFTVGEVPVLTELVLITQPGDGTSGVALEQQPALEFRDQNGAIFDTGLTVTATVTVGTATITAGGTRAAVAGLVEFSGLTLEALATEDVTITFSAEGVSDEVAAPLTLTVSLVATKLGLSQQPGGVVSGLQFSQQPVVLVQDASGVTVTEDDTTQVTLAVTTGTAVLSGTTTVTVVNGVATFNDLVLTGAESGVVLTATAAGLTSVETDPFTVAEAPSGSPGDGNPNTLPKYLASKVGAKSGDTLDALWFIE
jgi:hypothetical protein